MFGNLFRKFLKVGAQAAVGGVAAFAVVNGNQIPTPHQLGTAALAGLVAGGIAAAKRAVQWDESKASG